MKNSDIDLLDKFQRYAGRRVQRFSKRTPNETSFTTLGWMRLESYIYGKKLLFIRTITSLEHGNLYRQVFVKRFEEFCQDPVRCSQNRYDSPIFDILRIAVIFKLFERVKGMVYNDHIYSKIVWKRAVWDSVWQVECEDWNFRVQYFHETKLLNNISKVPMYANWWLLSDSDLEYISISETMTKIICRASNLKADRYEYRDKSILDRSCTLCDSISEENILHIVMQCEANELSRTQMLAEIEMYSKSVFDRVREEPTEMYLALLGKSVEDVTFEDMCTFWRISGRWICRMYNRSIKNRSGIG